MVETGSKKQRGSWVPHTGPLPPGITRGWNAVGGNRVWAGIFEVIGSLQPSAYVLVYHRVGEPKAVTERLPSMQMALDRGTEILNAGGIIGRPKGTDDPEFYRRHVPNFRSN